MHNHNPYYIIMALISTQRHNHNPYCITLALISTQRQQLHWQPTSRTHKPVSVLGSAKVTASSYP